MGGQLVPFGRASQAISPAAAHLCALARALSGNGRHPESALNASAEMLARCGHDMPLTITKADQSYLLSLSDPLSNKAVELGMWGVPMWCHLLAEGLDRVLIRTSHPIPPLDDNPLTTPTPHLQASFDGTIANKPYLLILDEYWTYMPEQFTKLIQKSRSTGHKMVFHHGHRRHPVGVADSRSSILLRFMFSPGTHHIHRWQHSECVFGYRQSLSPHQLSARERIMSMAVDMAAMAPSGEMREVFSSLIEVSGEWNINQGVIRDVLGLADRGHAIIRDIADIVLSRPDVFQRETLLVAEQASISIASNVGAVARNRPSRL